MNFIFETFMIICTVLALIIVYLVSGYALLLSIQGEWRLYDNLNKRWKRILNIIAILFLPLFIPIYLLLGIKQMLSFIWKDITNI